MIAIEHVRIGGNEKIGHEVNDVARREVGSRILVVRLGEALRQVLEDIAHIDRFDLLG